MKIKVGGWFDLNMNIWNENENVKDENDKHINVYSVFVKLINLFIVG